MARLGVLLFSSPDADPQMKAVPIRLRELGYKGQSLTLVYRYVEGKYERLPDVAAELVTKCTMRKRDSGRPV